jgi:uncharacterized damage-inducible protein DinB
MTERREDLRRERRFCAALQIAAHQMATGALQAHEQGLVWRGTTVTGLQIVLHVQQQGSRHFGIGHRTVGAAGGRQMVQCGQGT